MTPAETDTQARTETAYAYRAFISYSHRDKEVAQRLHRAIESYRIPSKLVGKVTALGRTPSRLRPIFRDREELPASGDLSAELTAALRQSMFLLVICSPAAAGSRWVNEEIKQFKAFHGDGRVLALVVDGEPHASEIPGRDHRECFPEAMRFRIGPSGELSDVPAEPIAADYRREADGPRLATQKLIAGLTGLKLDDLVQRETQRRIAQATAVAVGAVMGMVVTGGLAFYANSLRIEANAQRAIAEHEAAAARAASDYLVGTFELSNPATDNPRTITALTILSRSAERAQRELAGQPTIEARLLATLGRAYNNLGLLSEAQASLEKAMPVVEKAGPDGVDALLVLAQTYGLQGQIEKSLATVRHAERVIGPDPEAQPFLRAKASLARGRILVNASRVKDGLAALDLAVYYARRAEDAPPNFMASVLSNRGLLLSDDGQFAAAEASLQESLVLFQKELGPSHLQSGKAWFALAQNSFNAGQLPKARQQIAEALRIQRKVLDADNPILANTLSMQGQILQGLGQLGEAERSLREAVAIYRQAFGGPHFLIGIAEVYLAMIESARGDPDAALATLADAKRNYDASYGKIHPNHGDLLVNRAKILAKAGRFAEARSDCAAGVRILTETLGAEASFTRQLAGECKTISERAPSRVAAKS
ncbi:MAG: toll/interleukin-1 receptor domain-containing protein [Phenylobacterium sp.]|uniref:toll/interleukin-1 receptor domain-containing protein n=1 Tax=Phenylobacterium sp. TaxID=1871053 RepID=UPI0011F8E724|nr:toll/interleukin-1 receptor domain-containing protein [Phenylobacterium sp.]TAL31451.1 MAG: toll/interleukin-1 receptor domain-containing protein [Phenylobacterium sp.]